MLIAFEGMDGTGKTTQMQLLYEWLIKKNKKVFLTKQPGGSKFGEKIREILLYDKEDISDLAIVAMFMADRAQNVDKIIMPKLKEGYMVLCDRYTDSTIAYQGYGKGINLKDLLVLNKFSSHSLTPNFIIYLDINFKVGLERAKKVTNKQDNFEKLDNDFFQKVKYGFRKQYLKNRNKSIWIDIDNLSIEEVHQEIIKYLEDKMNV